MSWNDEVAKQRDVILVRLEVLGRVYGPHDETRHLGEHAEERYAHAGIYPSIGGRPAQGLGENR